LTLSCEFSADGISFAVSQRGLQLNIVGY